MNIQRLRLFFSPVAAFVMTAIGFGNPPTPQQALEYAKSVVLVKHVVQGDQIHSYVEAVWRFDSDGETPPPVGSEYGGPIPYDSRMMREMQFLERDRIFFEFGANRPKGLPVRWGIPVSEQGLVPKFEKSVFYDQGVSGEFGRVGKGETPMSVDEVRMAVEKAKPRA